MSRPWTLYLCHACGWAQSEETDDLTCARCGEPRTLIEPVAVVRVPYVHCIHPRECAGLSSCPRKLSCIE